ncbi:hypothetical protein [Alistipes sp.]|uniref:hypothetical protein n=1 Tax=Alistipes sp. TaxID=1872444 RepID=UPI0011C795D5
MRVISAELYETALRALCRAIGHADFFSGSVAAPDGSWRLTATVFVTRRNGGGTVTGHPAVAHAIADRMPGLPEAVASSACTGLAGTSGSPASFRATRSPEPVGAADSQELPELPKSQELPRATISCGSTDSSESPQPVGAADSQESSEPVAAQVVGTCPAAGAEAGFTPVGADPIVDLVPVWWEFHTWDDLGETLNDFSFARMKEGLARCMNAAA